MESRVLSALLLVVAVSLAFTACSHSAEQGKPAESGADRQAGASITPEPGTAPATAVASAVTPPSANDASLRVVNARVEKLSSIPTNAPKIIVGSTKMDFGRQPQSKTLNRDIVVRNAGKTDLAIESVTPSCGCTTVDFPKMLHPGRSGRIKLKVETGSSPGPHTKSVTIKTNDPLQPTVTVQFSFDVKG